MSEAPLFSVVIPAREHPDRLERTLESIANADFDLGRVEVIVVDDGSPAGTYDGIAGRAFPFRLSMHRVEFGSQAAATNEAIRHATGTYVLCSAQDIVFDSRLLAEHLAWHERFAGEDVAVVGYLPYLIELEITPFMHYLVNGGYQFLYYLIKDPLRVPPQFVYAPNVSIRRDVLVEVGAFDEQFPFGCQDTDLGIRLARAGVRIVYNADAIGHHNHPVTLPDFLPRQRSVGRCLARLERKHPDETQGPQAWDLALSGYLAVSDAELDLTERRIERLEARLAASGDAFVHLWTRAWVHKEPAERFVPAEREVLRVTNALFSAYGRLLQFHLSAGYLEESIELHGRKSVRARLLARIMRYQSSLQMRRCIERRMAALDMPVTLADERDIDRSLLLHDPEDYPAVLRLLEDFVDPATMRYNLQIVLAATAGVLSAEQCRRLDGVVEVVEAETADLAVLGALQRCRGALTTVRAAGVRPLDDGAERLVEKLMARLPQIGLLGGAPANGSSRSTCGFRFDGNPVEAPAARELTPVEIARPELCVIRTSTLDPFPAGAAADEPWHFVVGRRLAELGVQSCFLPELAFEETACTAAG